jgi:beta-lactam-binding protein with PASTA domain
VQESLRKIITIPLYILGFALMGLLSGYLAFKIMSFSKTVEVPDLRGKTLFEANDLLNKKGLYLKVEGEDYDSVVVPGLIVRQDIPSGNKVKEQRGIKVFLSKGPRVWTIPDLVGMNIGEAEPLISKSGLRVLKTLSIHSATVERDIIIAQRPNPDETLETGAPQKPQDLLGQRRGLSLIVSAGPYDTIYYCPDFVGKSRDDAVNLSEKLGLNTEFTGSGERVKSQKPKPNSPLRHGEIIHLQLEGG